VLSFPPDQGELLDRQRASFLWPLSSSASLTVNSEAMATFADGEIIHIGPVTCD
jgi:hypothetical protein